MKKLKLLLIMGLFILPVVASYLTYYFWQPTGRKNYGTLLEQVEVKANGTDLNGKPETVKTLKGKWVMVYVGSGKCGDECTQLLYYMRQIRKVQGKEMGRIERLWLIDDEAVPSQRIQNEHEGMHYIRVSDRQMLDQFPDRQAGHYLYMVDPLGHLMMRWPQHADPDRVIQDIKLLLKASQIG